MYFRSVILMLMCQFVAVINGPAQQYQMDYYTVNDGLPSNNIRRIFQDSKGFIWIGTLEGLCKYDGQQFTNYTIENGLPHNLVNDMLEIKPGMLFFACNDGSLVWMQHERIIKITHPGAVINQFYKTRNGNILVATDADGIEEFNEDGKLYKPPQFNPKAYYYSIAQINDSLLLVGSDSSVQILTNQYRLVKRIAPQATYYGENKVLKDSRGRLWATYLPGPVLITNDGKIVRGIIQLDGLVETKINHVIEDNSGTIWFAGVNGIIQLTNDNITNLIKKKNGLPSDIVNFVFQDREENIWIATNLGICKIPHSKTDFTTYNESAGLAHPAISFIYSDKQRGIIVSTIKGWQLFNEKEGKYSPVIEEKELPYILFEQPPHYFSIHTDDGQPLLKNTKVGKDIYNFLSRVKIGERFNLVSNREGLYFISFGSKFYIYDGVNVFEDSVFGLSVGKNYSITGLAIDQKGALWVGTWNDGLFKIEFEHKKNAGLRFLNKEILLSGTPIRSVMKDWEGNIWAGTRYNGVYRIRETNDGSYKIENWNISSGLSSNWIHTLYQDEKENMWLLYHDGLDKLIKNDSDYRPFNFSRVNNFIGDFYKIISVGDKKFWLGTADDGLVRMLDGELENKPPWPVVFCSINIGDSQYNVANIPAVLPYKQNNLQIDFSALTFINEKQVMYSYRLNGRENTTWSIPQNKHNVSLVGLRPGKYSFEVKSLGWNGQWGQPSVLHFTIQPPLVQRGWFLILVGLILAVIITFLVRYRIKQIRHEAAMKQQLAETEMMALRAQMNPHFLFNSLNAIDNLIQTKQHDKATTYLGRFARLLRMVLDSSKNKLVPFDRDFAALQLYIDMERFRSSDKFQYEISASPELLNGGYHIPPLLAQPFIENAIHHGLLNKQSNDRMLKVKATLLDDYIMFRVEDNGIGRKKAMEINAMNRPEHVSYGWQITAQRLGLHNGGDGINDIIIHDLYQDNEATGTCVILKIKINTN